MLVRHTKDTNTAERLLRGSFVLALLCSCSSAETDGANPSGTTSDPSLTTSSGSSETSASTGASGTQASTGASGTQASTGASGTQTVTGAGGVGTSGTQTSTETTGTQTVTGAGGAGTSGTQTGAGGSETTASTSGGQTDVGTGGSETTSATTTGSGGTDTGPDDDVIVFLAGDNVNADGPLGTVVENPNFSGGGHILVRPESITSEPNAKHPVAIWGPGGGTAPDYYMQLLTRMASQGFVVVGIRESTGDSVLMSAAIDWLEEQNENTSSPMYDRLILNRVGVFGHSMGGLSSEATALVDDRVSTALLDNSGSFSHDALVNLTIPVGIIYGETGQERPNAEGDFNNPGNKGPCWLSMMKGGGHGSGPWDGASANVAWMRWHLGGENFRKDAFIGAGGDYNDTGIWVTEFKNWEGWKNWNE